MSHQILSLLLLAVFSNLDNLGVGAALGMRGIRVPLGSNFLIAGVTGSGTWLSVLLGARLYQYISATTAGVVGGLVILASGLWVWFEEPLLRRVASPSPVVSEPHAEWRQVVDVVVDPGAADLDHSGVIEAREALLLAAGLTLNNLPNGVAAGVLGLPAVPMTGAVCLASLCSIGLGVAIGRHGMRWAGRAARPVAALMLMLLGVYEICVSG